MMMAHTGALLFGAGEKLEHCLELAGAKDDVRVVVLDMSNVTVMDSSGLEVIEEQLKRLKAVGKHLLMCGLHRQPLRTLVRAGFVEHLGRANVFRSSKDALVAAARLVVAWKMLVLSSGDDFEYDAIEVSPMAPGGSQPSGGGGRMWVELTR